MNAAPLKPGPFIPRDMDGPYRCIACSWPLSLVSLEPPAAGVEAIALTCTGPDCNLAFILEHRDGRLLDAGWGEVTDEDF
jgi:hypothetical protein